jgi:hypothetical protein
VNFSMRPGKKIAYGSILVIALAVLAISAPALACVTPAPTPPPVPPTPPGPTPSWYDCGWQFRKAITIAHTKVAGSQSGFPVLISLASDSGLQARARPDGDDILFTSSDGTTRLSHEIETYSGSTGLLIAWVKVPSLTSGSDTVLYMYYGNPDAPTQQDSTSVWDTNFRGVWHLSEMTGSKRHDSTVNRNDLSDINRVTLSPGKIDGSARFAAASSQRLTIPDAGQAGLDITGPITMEAWVSTGQAGDGPYYFIEKAKGSCSSGEPPYYFRLNDGNTAYERENALVNGACGGTGLGINGPMTSISAGTWNHLVAVYDGSSLRVYKNGIQTNSRPYSSGIYNSDGDLNIGGRSRTQYFDGLLDEVRISSAARSLEWIQTEFNNQNSPSTFAYVWGEEKADDHAVCTTPPPAFTCTGDSYPLVTPDGETAGCVAITNDWTIDATTDSTTGETTNTIMNTLSVSYTLADTFCLKSADVAFAFNPARVPPQYTQPFESSARTKSYTFNIPLGDTGDVAYLYITAHGMVQKVTGEATSAGMDVVVPENPIYYIMG